MPEEAFDYADDRYFTRLAAAFARGRLGLPREEPDAQALRAGFEAGLKMHKFKRLTMLPRVQRVLGLLRGLSPISLLDIGSGRGAFLWPLLDAFPALEITAIDREPVRVRDLEAARWGGVKNLRALEMDAQQLGFPDNEFDVVTMLEVLEHLPNPAQAAREAVRVAQRFVVISVPSREDDNPEHINLFTTSDLTSLFKNAGAARVQTEYVLNHLIAIARC